jgi:hypothetical protein
MPNPLCAFVEFASYLFLVVTFERRRNIVQNAWLDFRSGEIRVDLLAATD